MADERQSPIAQELVERKVYNPPAIIHELKLETRAGSPLQPELTDPLGIDPAKPQVN